MMNLRAKYTQTQYYVTIQKHTNSQLIYD